MPAEICAYTYFSLRCHCGNQHGTTDGIIVRRTYRRSLPHAGARLATAIDARAECMIGRLVSGSRLSVAVETRGRALEDISRPRLRQAV